MAIDTSVYERQRRGINDQYTQQAATNAFGRFISQQRGERGIADYTRDWKRSTPKFTASYARRGMAGSGVRSGVYNQAMRNYVGDYQQNLNRQYADVAQQGQQSDLELANYTAARDRAIADMEADKAREIANAAQYLTALKPQFS